MRRRPNPLALAVLLSLIVSMGAIGCRRTPTSVAGRLSVVDGRAEIGRPGEDRREVTGSQDLRVGDVVRVREGASVIRLPGGGELELRSGTDLELRARDGAERSRPTLSGGDLLVRSAGPAVAVSSGAEDVAVRGIARVAKGLSLVVGVYEGSVTVNSAARSIEVPALRQVAVPAAGLFPARPSPLDLSGDDGWDQRYLSGAIALSSELLARSRGFSAQLTGAEGRTVGYFRDLLPRLAGEPAFQASLLNPSRPPGETLVGAAIVLESTRGSFADRWTAVFGFHDDGAPWGLVALDQGVSRVPLLATIESAVSRSPTSFALARPGAPTALTPPTTRTPSPPQSGVTSGAVPAPPRATTPARPPASVPTTVPPTGPLNSGAPVIDNSVNGLVNTLTGLLNSLGQR